MDRRNVTWIWMIPLLVVLDVAQTTEPLTDLDYIAGKLVFYQTEGNATYIRNTGHLSSDVPTETSFEFFDPHKNFSMEHCTYTWDLGNGEVIHGSQPAVQYHYPEPGNYTVRLKVALNVTKYAPEITGVYSTDVQVLDAIKQIKMKGSSGYEVSQDTSFAFHIDGSPPMWVCWRFLPNCVPDVTGGCTLTMLYDHDLRLNHTFTTAGIHCVDISVRNDISKMNSSFSLDVKRNYNIQIYFIMFCAAVLVAAVAYITRRRYSRSQFAVSSNATFLKKPDRNGQSMSLLDFSDAEKGDKEPLLRQYGTQYSS